MILDTSVLPPLERIPASQLRHALAELLAEYRVAVDTGVRPDSSSWVRRLFGLLGWRSRDAVLREHRRATQVAGGLEILRCDLLGYDAFKVAVLPWDTSASWTERAGEAVEYLYNQGDEWAVVSDFERLEIVNVRWVEKQRAYVPFRHLVREQYVDDVHTLALLTPDRIRDRDLIQQAEVEAPHQKWDKARVGDRAVRPPITRVVLEQILASRRDFLHDPPEGQTDAESYDNQIHRLLTRLIFIRACEDMQLNVSQPLHTLLNQGTSVRDLEQILGDYRRLYNSELFDDLDLRVFHWHLIQQAVHSLYQVPDVVKFNFAAMEADVLGEMYEDYLQWQAVRVTDQHSAAQRGFFELRRVETENIKRQRGIYYTPAFLVEAMVEEALNLVGAPQGRFADGGPVLVADIACGSGAFLSAAFERVAGAEANGTYQTAAALLQQVVAGTDVDPRAVESTRLNLWLSLFRLYPQVHPLPRLAKTVLSRDALVGPLVTESPGDELPQSQPELFDTNEHPGGAVVPRLARRPDVILGNPPFVKYERTTPTYRIQLRDEGYTTLTGRYDLANVFVERALDSVREGGIVALVVPNRIFTTAAAAALRQLIAEKAQIEQVIDFGAEQVFAATAYVSVIFLRRTNPDGRRAQMDVPVVKVERFHEPRGLQLREALAGNDTPGIRRYEARLPRTSAPILLVPGWVSSLLRDLQRKSVRLGELARTPEGIRLGAQGLYLVAEQEGLPSPESHLLGVRSFGEVGGKVLHALLERDALRPAVHSGEIQRYRTPRSSLWLLYPYKNGHLIPFAEYAERFPEAARYLSEHQALLSRRARVADRPWHGLAEPRDETWLRAPKILVPELAKEGRMALDEQGRYLVQGFGVHPCTPLDLHVLLATLNSTLLVWLTAINAPKFRGGNFRYQGSTLGKLPIPSAILEEADLQAELRELARQLMEEYSRPEHEQSPTRLVQLESQVDARVYDAAGLGAGGIRFVEEEVARFRPKIPLREGEDLLSALRGIRSPGVG